MFYRTKRNQKAKIGATIAKQTSNAYAGCTQSHDFKWPKRDFFTFERLWKSFANKVELKF